MARRRLVVLLLMTVVVQLLGMVTVAATECVEPCPDDTETSSCPPVCALCTSCTHAQTGMVENAVSEEPGLPAHQLLQHELSSAHAHFSAEIFHVPLG